MRRKKPRAMNRKDIIEEVAKRTHVPKNWVEPIYDEIMRVIRDAIRNGQRVTIKGLVTFDFSRRRAQRRVIKAVHGEVEVNVPDRVVPIARVSKPLKREVIQIFAERERTQKQKEEKRNHG